MALIVGAALLALLLSLIFTPLCRDTSLRFGFADQPDPGGRKLHTAPVARIGGVAIFLATIGSAGFMVALQSFLHLHGPDWTVAARLLPATAVVVLTGLIDDLHGLHPWQKMAGQAAGAALVCAGGVQIHSVAGYELAHTWWHTPVTMVWLIACSNAVNLIDGIDGLAAGIGLFATCTTLVAALWTGNPALALAAAPQAAALAGFLRYNLNPATIFLGDCGSLSIGFLLGCYGVIWAEKSTTVLGTAAPIIALCIPLVEIVISIARRFLRGKPLFGADRRHIHHRLLDLGFHPRRVVLVMYGAAAVAAGCSLLVSIAGPRSGGVAVLLFCVAAGIALQRLGYGEFREAGSVVFGGLLARLIDTQVSLCQLEGQLAEARTFEERRLILTAAAGKLGFDEMRVEVGNRVWLEHIGTSPRQESWQLRVPLRGNDFAEFSIALNVRRHPVMLTAFAKLVRRHLTACEIDTLRIRSATPIAERKVENVRSG